MFGKKNFGKLISFFIIFLLSGLFLAWKLFHTPLALDAVVAYNGENFSPEKVTIKKGGKVVFKNESNKDFWPASDFHPSNGVYQEFDSKKSIAKGEIWEFTFTQTGEWGYHDHLFPFHKGTVVVKDDKLFSIGKECKNINNLSYQERELCWYKQVKKEIQEKGIEGALGLISKLYSSEPLFGQGCHDMTHLIGDEAYREFKEGKTFKLGIETGYCGFGFYHGFIEAMLYTNGDYDEVRKFCESLTETLKGEIKDDNAMYACYHGIGHSTFDIHDPGLWGSEARMVNPAIATCEKITLGLPEQKTKQCVTGVFNALGIAYSNDQYNLKMKESDPVWFCRGFKPLYRGPCFIEVALSWIHKQGGGQGFDFAEAADFIGKTGDAVGEAAATHALASEHTRLSIGNFDVKEAITNCRGVKQKLFDSCMEGMEEGFFLWGKPEEEYRLAILFCNSEMLDGGEKGKCFEKVLSELFNKYSDEKRKSICAGEIEAKYQIYCN